MDSCPYPPQPRCLPFSSRNDGATPLHVAAYWGHQDILCVLLESAVFREDTRKDKAKVSNNGGCTPLHHAATSKRADAARVLLNCGASPFSQDKEGGVTPLHVAANKGYHNILRVLLESAVSHEDTRKDKFNMIDRAGIIPLSHTAYWGNLKCVESLVQAGADVFKNGGYLFRTALHQAPKRGHSTTVDSMLRHLSIPWANIKDEKLRMWRECTGDVIPPDVLPGGLEALSQASGGETELVVSKWKGFVPK